MSTMVDQETSKDKVRDFLYKYRWLFNLKELGKEFEKDRKIGIKARTLRDKIRRGFKTQRGDQREEVREKLKELGINGRRKRIPIEEIGDMKIFKVKNFVSLTPFSEEEKEEIMYRFYDNRSQGEHTKLEKEEIERELANVMRELSKELNS